MRKPTALRNSLCVHIRSLAYIVSLKKKTLRASQYIRKQGKQTIYSEKDAMKAVYLNFLGCFPQAIHILM